MAIRLVGAGQAYTTILAAFDNVRLTTSLTGDEIVELVDGVNYTLTTSSDVDCNLITLNGWDIILRVAAGVRHNGDFGNGARISASINGGILYNRRVIVEDLSVENTWTGSANGACANNVNGGFRRCIFRSDAGSNQVIKLGAGSTIVPFMEACRTEGGIVGVQINRAQSDIQGVTVIGASNIGFESTVTMTGVVKNNVAYNIGATDFGGLGTFGTANNNASEDGTHPGTAGVTLVGTPFEVDGFTPSSGGQLDGAGANLSLGNDAANNAFDLTSPAIGAYEVTAAPSASAVITGTLNNSFESDIVAGGKTTIITLTNDTWLAAGATFDAQRQAIISGVTAQEIETTGWNNEVRDLESVAAVVRTSATVVTITWSASPAYNIIADENIDVTVPSAALVTSGVAVAASPSSTVSAATQGNPDIIATPTFTVAASSGTTVTSQQSSVFTGSFSRIFGRIN